MCTYFNAKTDGAQNLINEFFSNFLYTELNERAEAATGSYSGTGDSLQYIYCVPISKNHRNIRSRCLVHEFSFKDFPYRAAILKKNYLWLLPFYVVWLLISFIKRCAERCALQLYQTFLIQTFSSKLRSVN